MGLNLNGQPDPVVVHAGAVLSIFHLLPAVEHQDQKVSRLIPAFINTTNFYVVTLLNYFKTMFMTMKTVV